MSIVKLLTIDDMDKIKIIVVASSAKRRAGGGFQITTNFLLRSLSDDRIDWVYVVSQDVDDSIGEKFTSLKGKTYFVVPPQPTIKGYYKVKNLLANLENTFNPDLIYTIISPSYFKFKTREIMRHTDPYTFNSSDLAYTTWSWKSKIFQKLKEISVRRMLRNAYAFETQSQAVADETMKATGKHVEVISNILPASYLKVDVLSQKVNHDNINIVYVTAGQPHKCLYMVPQVVNLLVHKYNKKNIHFTYTIPFGTPQAIYLEELADQYRVKDYIENAGYLKQEQLIDLYLRSDIGFFASLLETFSATLLEYMYFRLPMVVTDLPFNSEVTKDAALYFFPKNVEEAAAKLNELIEKSELRDELLLHAENRMKCFVDYDENYNHKIDFLMKCAK